MENECTWCGALIQYHAGWGKPYHRRGWFHFDCGTRWHPQYGWSRDFGGRCEANVYKKALRFIAKPRACDIKKARRTARVALVNGAQY